MRFYNYKNQEDWLLKNGFNENGITYVIGGGNTFEIKDTLKELGCKFSPLLKWHSPQQLDIDGFICISFTFDELYIWVPADKNVVAFEGAMANVKGKISAYSNMRTLSSSSLTNSEWLGEIGDRIRKVPVKIIGKKDIFSRNGYITLFTFEYGNSVLCWFTTTTKFEQEGDEVLLSATIKDHKIYEGQKQTYITRCFMYPID